MFPSSAHPRHDDSKREELPIETCVYTAVVAPAATTVRCLWLTPHRRAAR